MKKAIVLFCLILTGCSKNQVRERYEAREHTYLPNSLVLGDFYPKRQIFKYTESGDNYRSHTRESSQEIWASEDVKFEDSKVVYIDGTYVKVWYRITDHWTYDGETIEEKR